MRHALIDGMRVVLLISFHCFGHVESEAEWNANMMGDGHDDACDILPESVPGCVGHSAVCDILLKNGACPATQIAPRQD
jgi:hypothetical protein